MSYKSRTERAEEAAWAKVVRRERAVMALKLAPQDLGVLAFTKDRIPSGKDLRDYKRAVALRKPFEDFHKWCCINVHNVPEYYFVDRYAFEAAISPWKPLLKRTARDVWALIKQTYRTYFSK